MFHGMSKQFDDGRICLLFFDHIASIACNLILVLMILLLTLSAHSLTILWLIPSRLVSLDLVLPIAYVLTSLCCWNADDGIGCTWWYWLDLCHCYPLILSCLDCHEFCLTLISFLMKFRLCHPYAHDNLLYGSNSAPERKIMHETISVFIHYRKWLDNNLPW